MPTESHYSTLNQSFNHGELTNCFILLEFQSTLAEVAEQADALRSGRSEHYAHVGSTPTFGIFIFSQILFEKHLSIQYH